MRAAALIGALWLLAVAAVIIVCELRPSQAPRRALSIALGLAAVCVVLT